MVQLLSSCSLKASNALQLIEAWSQIASDTEPRHTLSAGVKQVLQPRTFHNSNRCTLSMGSAPTGAVESLVIIMPQAHTLDAPKQPP